MPHGTHRIPLVRPLVRLTSLTSALVLTAGVASPLFAQTTPDRPVRETPARDTPARDTPARDRAPAPTDRTPGTRTPTTPPTAKEPARTSFHLASDMIGTEVVNPREESLGKVVDFVFDRGSGRLEHALVESGAFLGMGGRTVAIPFDAFACDAEEERFVLSMSQDEIKQVAKVAPEQWKQLEGTAWDDHLTPRQTSRAAAHQAEVDAQAIAIAAATEEALDGKIVAIRRIPVAASGEEEVIAVIETRDGQTREVVLGPSWFVMSRDIAPMRGDELRMRTRTVGVEGATPRTHASSATIRDTTIGYRDEGARPLWRTARGADGDAAGSDRDGKRLGRLMLLSDLVGADARPLDEDGGDIDDAVIEFASGRIALLCFDPDENFLGLGDTVRCVPWSIALIDRKGDVRFDASREMLLNAAPMADDVSVYRDANRLREAHAAFGIESPRFDGTTRTTSR